MIREYGGSKEPLLRNDGEVYVISPYAMFWNDDVRLSPTFYGWVFGFKGGIRILEPAEAVNEIKELAESQM